MAAPTLLALLCDLRAQPEIASDPSKFLSLIEPHVQTIPSNPTSQLIPPIFDLMLQHPTSHQIQNFCSTLLSTLSHETPLAAKEIADGKGVQLLFHTLLLHKDSHDINYHALSALSAVLPVAEGIEPVVYQFFGVDVLVTAAKLFIDDLKLQYCALRILLTLAKSDDGDDDLAAARRAAHARAALRALKRHRREEQLAQMACELLYYVARHADGESLEQLAAIGCVRMLAATIVAWKDNEAVMEHAFGALAALVRGEDECARQFAEMRGVELAIRGMRRFRGNAELQLSCVIALRMLTNLDDGQAMLMFNAGGLEAVISCMIEYRRNEEIQEHAIWLLDRLAWLRNDVRLKIISVGGFRTINSTLKTHIMNEQLVEMGVRALRKIRSNK